MHLQLVNNLTTLKVFHIENISKTSWFSLVNVFDMNPGLEEIHMEDKDITNLDLRPIIDISNDHRSLRKANLFKLKKLTFINKKGHVIFGKVLRDIEENTGRVISSVEDFTIGKFDVDCTKYVHRLINKNVMPLKRFSAMFV
jgi:hypothetical protein